MKSSPHSLYEQGTERGQAHVCSATIAAMVPTAKMSQSPAYCGECVLLSLVHTARQATKVGGDHCSHFDKAIHCCFQRE
jgi:hypothetical protein